MMSHKTIAIIETLILMAIFGALALYLIFNGSSVGELSFITGR